MKILNEEIEFCGECPYCRYDRVAGDFNCEKDRNTIDEALCHITHGNINYLVPPDWCPLPTKEV